MVVRMVEVVVVVMRGVVLHLPQCGWCKLCTVQASITVTTADIN